MCEVTEGEWQIRRDCGLSWIWLCSAAVLVVVPGTRVLVGLPWCCFRAQSICLRPRASPEHPSIPKPQLTLAIPPTETSRALH